MERMASGRSRLAGGGADVDHLLLAADAIGGSSLGPTGGISFGINPAAAPVINITFHRNGMSDQVSWQEYKFLKAHPDHP